MKRWLRSVCILLAILGVSSCIHAFPYPDEAHKGRIIDAETGEPIEGVVVLGVWTAQVPMGGNTYFNSKEVLTDAKGEFNIPPLSIPIMTMLPNGRFVQPMNINICKAGYEPFDYRMWDSFKEDEGIRKHPIKWEGKRAVIPLLKLKPEDKQKWADRCGDIPSHIPEDKARLWREEDKNFYGRYLPSKSHTIIYNSGAAPQGSPSPLPKQ